MVGGTSFAHLWGTSAIGGIVHGLLGVQPTAPGYRTFTIKPRMGGLAHASLRLPTLYGFINVTATPSSLSINVPCNTMAKACILLPEALRSSRRNWTLVLDGEVIGAAREGLHLCSEAPVVCGVGGRDRVLAL